MDVQNFVFNTPKTCFNAVTGQKIATDALELHLFRNQWTYAFSIYDGAVLRDDKNHEIAQRNDVMIAFARFYLLENEDKTQSLYDASGKVLFDKVQGVLMFPCGWFIVCQNDERALYRDDASLVLKGFRQVKLVQDGDFVLAEYEPDDWTIYRRDGSLIAEHVKNFQFMDNSFYCFAFEDKNVVYDDEKKTQFAAAGAFPRLMPGHKFADVSNGQWALFRSDGKKIMMGHKDYFSLSNGLFVVKRDDDSIALCNDKRQVLHASVDGIGSGGYQQFLLVTADGQDYLYDNEGKLIYRADSLTVCGGGFFLEKKKNQKIGTLLKYDLSVVAESVVNAEVFHNGWMMLEKADYRAENRVFELRNQNARCVAVSNCAIEYNEDFHVWIKQNKKGKYILCHEDCGCAILDADKIIFAGALALSKRGNICSVYSLTKMNEHSPEGQKIDMDFLLPIWSGSRRDLVKDVALCGGSCIGNEDDFYELFRRPGRIDSCYEVIHNILGDDDLLK